MPVLVEVFMNELANGNVPAPGSEEAKAYQAWSKEYERAFMVRQIVKESALKVYGSDYYLLGTMV